MENKRCKFSRHDWQDNSKVWESRCLCQRLLYSVSRRRDYGLNAGHVALHEGCLLFSVLKNNSRTVMIIFTKFEAAFLKKLYIFYYKADSVNSLRLLKRTGRVFNRQGRRHRLFHTEPLDWWNQSSFWSFLIGTTALKLPQTHMKMEISHPSHIL